MIYVMSDIHGQYEAYMQMLEKINFSDEDELYVLGDVVDRGTTPIKILQDMSMRANVFPIMGNHDYMAYNMLAKLSVEITEQNYGTHLTDRDIKTLTLWMADGGDTTRADVRKLTRDEQSARLEYMLEFAPYEELSVGGRDFVLVHGGLPDFKEEKPLSAYCKNSMLIERPDYSIRYYKDKFVINGHTPTKNIGEEYAGKIYKANGHIAIDCGAGWNIALGCLRLDDLKEFYVSIK